MTKSVTKNLETIVPIWTINGQLEPHEVDRQIKRMKRDGYTAVLPIMFSTGVGDIWGDVIDCEFLSETYFDQYTMIVDACRQENLKLWIWDDLYCPAGWAGGLMKKAHPKIEGLMLCRDDNAPQTDSSTETIITRNCKFSYIAKSAGEKIVDVFAPGSAEAFIEIVLEKYYCHFKEDFGKTVAAIFHDEPGVPGMLKGLYPSTDGYIETHLPWSDSFPKAFYEKFGYDLIEIIPLLYAEHNSSHDAKAIKIRHDFANFVNEMFRENWLLPLRNWCKARGVMFLGHLNNDDSVSAHGNSAGALLPSLKCFDIPAVDVIVGQLFPGKESFPASDLNFSLNNFNSHFPRFASSAAHANSRCAAMAEIGAVYGTGFGIGYRKWLADYMFACGVQIHNVAQLSYNKTHNNTLGAAEGCDINQPFNPYMKFLNAYQKITAKLLCLGRPSTNHAVFYSADCYCADTYIYHDENFNALIEYLLFMGIEPDITDLQGDRPYKYIYIPAGVNLSQNDIIALTKYAAENNATVFAPVNCGLSDIPVATCYQTGEWDKTKKLLDNAKDIYADLAPWLTQDIIYSHSQTLKFHSRTLDDGSRLFFVFNDSADVDFSGAVLFQGKEYDIYVKKPENTYFRHHGNTELSLEAQTSAILLFVKDAKTPPQEIASMISDKQSQIATPLLPEISWNLQLAERVIWNGGFVTNPISTTEADKLLEQEIFSGKLTYEGLFETDASSSWQLAFTALKQIAEVYVNGTLAGRILWKPWTLNIDSQFLKKGRNLITLKISNTLADYCLSDEFSKLSQKAKLHESYHYHNMSRALDMRMKGIEFKQKIN